MAAQGAGIQPQLLVPGQGLLQAVVQGLLGADDGVAQVMAHQHRMPAVGQVAVGQAHLDRGRAPTRRRLVEGARDAEAEAAQGGLVRDVVGRGKVRQDEASRLPRRPGPGRRRGGQARGGAGHEQVKVAREGPLLGAQFVVGGVFHVPGLHAGQAAGAPGHGAVALMGGIEFQALAPVEPDLVVIDQAIVHHRGVLAARPRRSCARDRAPPSSGNPRCRAPGSGRCRPPGGSSCAASCFFRSLPQGLAG
jgi:hypothetical protein